jgi:hypothetical protein
MEITSTTTEAKNVLSFIDLVISAGFLDSTKLNNLKQNLGQALATNSENKILEIISQADLYFEECGQETMDAIKKTLPRIENKEL